MGATGWSYFVPFQEDIERALQELRRKVFAEGRYEAPGAFDAGKHEERVAYLKSVYEKLPPGERRDQAMGFVEMARAAGKQLQGRKKPPKAKSIRRLLEQCGESGTHSIIDIERISPTPELTAISPLSGKQLLEFFGTQQPTREMITRWSERVEPPDTPPLYERWQGIYIVVFENARPVEIYFEGASGD